MTTRKRAQFSGTVSSDPVMTSAADPGPLPFGGPPAEWNDGLYQRVITAIYALPSYFQTSLVIAGIRATDLYTLNTALGAAIEQSVVDNLNSLRSIWDPSSKFSSYSFVRQPQAFPDVRLQASSPVSDQQILMGIELKGWFALSKEGEPSFRYLINPQVCAQADLLVVFPWILDEVISGRPTLLRPFVTEARYAAEQRNFYWQVSRGKSGPDAAIRPAKHTAPYPAKADKANDAAVSDPGKNFGRVARTKLMAEFIAHLMMQPIAGIPLNAWQQFIRIFAEGISSDDVQKRLASIAEHAAKSGFADNDIVTALDNLMNAYRALLERLG